LVRRLAARPVQCARPVLTVTGSARGRELEAERDQSPSLTGSLSGRGLF
jgi:hypothetical protein